MGAIISAIVALLPALEPAAAAIISDLANGTITEAQAMAKLGQALTALATAQDASAAGDAARDAATEAKLDEIDASKPSAPPVSATEYAEGVKEAISELVEKKP